MVKNNKTRSLHRNGILTNGVVKAIKRNDYIMNEMDVSGPDNYHFEYVFKHKDDSVVGFFEILTPKYGKYFNKIIKVNDTIKIKYDNINPSNSIIVSD